MWAYDNLGREISRTLPLGMKETFEYDPEGNMMSKVDFNGDEILYTYFPCCGRLEIKTYPDGTSVTYTFTPNGKVETVTDTRGITSNTYDSRDRLLEVAGTTPGPWDYSQ